MKGRGRRKRRNSKNEEAFSIEISYGTSAATTKRDRDESCTVRQPMGRSRRHACTDNASANATRSVHLAVDERQRACRRARRRLRVREVTQLHEHLAPPLVHWRYPRRKRCLILACPDVAHTGIRSGSMTSVAPLGRHPRPHLLQRLSSQPHREADRTGDLSSHNSRRQATTTARHRRRDVDFSGTSTASYDAVRLARVSRPVPRASSGNESHAPRSSTGTGWRSLDRDALLVEARHRAEPRSTPTLARGDESPARQRGVGFS